MILSSTTSMRSASSITRLLDGATSIQVISMHAHSTPTLPMFHFARSAGPAAEVSAEASAHWKATAASRSKNPCESSVKRALWQSVSTFQTAAADPLWMKSSALIIGTVPPLPSRPDSSGRPSGPPYR
jgi:hypothetical protein